MASSFGVPSDLVKAGPCSFMPSVSNVHAVLNPARSTATSFPCVRPTYNVPPARAGDEYRYQWLNPNECSTAPDFASSAYNRLESEVTKYTFPSLTAGDDTTHEPFAENAHFFSPVFASRAYRRE